ncbi:SDR family NAD(P)-dependent oxidoreductase [Nitrospirillum amazonense]|uniref:SDR family NAD(P)-dependent oxidoreductase n=1 Tax=Nitrospirillum amazonense TaxID=28077 RepID=UPI00241282F8|nr:SDR family NAD(P)-dependent oxidoreductase [Nitrospirillum amazonense]MDG3444037.1 SDR family NAD(P)-dependent oxidoreductase [Nitrospirillum amazonense]
MQSPNSILITGASSGIGEALALAYAARGRQLWLTGRDSARLDAVAEAARAKGARVTAAALDVLDRQALADWIKAADDGVPIDLAIANAGISGGTGGGAAATSGETEEQARRILAVNIEGVLNTVHPLIPRMVARKRGQLALMSSLAAFRGMPGAPAYCASKAAVRSYGEGLRGELMGKGVQVNVICPGFVRSRMTAVNSFPMPFLMDADKAARIVVRGLAANRARIAFPWPTYAVSWLLGVLPPGLTDALLAQAPRKV